ncbi:hypothetical protein EJ08DRAFT_421247 [Tothia fuscella]|uniref:C2H2-type domain-containing protein n=1 Tax=Tothia fuscella TaxID=1048955 RepID=A0A9P4NJF3_9PEZI|nr:hypothetical protein EJ08DRAFT_421247 [Tothia fuscella]
MPPRSAPAPAPMTESAREARRAFFCDLCQKGYSRMNEYDAHQSSYEHNHRQRLKDMKQMQKDPLAAEKARKAELKADKAGLKSVKLSDSAAGRAPRIKKGGFKTVFKSNKVDEEGGGDGGKGSLIPGLKEVDQAGKSEEGKRGDDGPDYPGKGIVDWGGNDEIWNEPNPVDPDYYDPTRPGGCGPNCPCPLAQAKKKAAANIPQPMFMRS